MVFLFSPSSIVVIVCRRRAGPVGKLTSATYCPVMSRLVPLSILIRSRGRGASGVLSGLAAVSAASCGFFARSIQPLG